MKKIESLKMRLDSKIYWSLYWLVARKSDVVKIDYYDDLNDTIFLWRLHIKGAKEKDAKLIQPIINDLVHQAEKTCGLR